MSRQRIKEIFQRALDTPPHERPSFLDSVCGEDAGLRHEVEALLGAHEEAGEFLAGPTEGGDSPPPANTDVDPGERPGAVIGRYQLCEEIGRGGFGVVWRAEQLEPVRREVALKVIKLGMDTKQVVARFEAERQALALMDHPHIAKVLDGGAAPSGRPYFVMERVAGLPITEYCDRQGLDTRRRLELFAEVCHAVQHAHQKGIIHRDLKPTNVLVAGNGAAVPKVIDFGIAKATDKRLTEQTLSGDLGQMIGTPEYMSPEQAELTAPDVDTRADIYSLGVMLYELLTGCRPLEVREMKEAGYHEILRRIREVEPPKPSTRISTLGAKSTEHARRRHTTPGRLGKQIRGDLDWIVMKALEKDRNRRYPTAIAFAEDVDRYLRDEPVRAGPPSAAYRLRKYVRRHRVGVSAGLLVALSLIFGLGAAIYGLSEARDQRDAAGLARDEALDQRRAAEEARVAEVAQRKRAEAGERKAKRARDRALAALDVLQEIMGAVNPRGSKSPGFTVRQLLDDFERRLEDRPEQDPWVNAVVHSLLGSTYGSIGSLEKAEHHLTAALRLDREVWGRKGINFAQDLNALGVVRSMQGRREEAESLQRRSLAAYREARGEDDPRMVPYVVNLAGTLSDRGKLDEAEQLLRKALATCRQALGPEHRSTALCLSELSGVLVGRGKLKEAEKGAREALAIQRRLSGDRNATLARMLYIMGGVLAAAGDHEEAATRLQEALAIQREVFPAPHPEKEKTISALATVLENQGKLDAAEATCRAALEMSRGLFGETDSAVAWNCRSLASILAKKGNHAAAERMFLKALETQRASTEVAPPALAETLLGLANVLQSTGRLEAAEKRYREAIETMRRCYGNEHTQIAIAMGNLGLVRFEREDIREAETISRESLAMLRRIHGDEHPRVVLAMVNLAFVLKRKGAYDEAERLLREALIPLRARPGREDALLLRTQNLLASILYRNGKLSEAERIQEAAVSQARKRYGEMHIAVLEGLVTLANIARKRGELDRAEGLLRRRLAIQRKIFDENHPDLVRAVFHLGTFLRQRGKPKAAEPLLREALALKRKVLPKGHPEIASALAHLGWALLDLERFDDAEPVVRECLEIRTRALPEGNWLRASAISMLGFVIAGQARQNPARFPEAEKLLLDGYQKMKAPAGKETRVREALERLVKLYTWWGKPDRAAVWRKKLEETQAVK